MSAVIRIDGQVHSALMRIRATNDCSHSDAIRLLLERNALEQALRNVGLGPKSLVRLFDLRVLTQ